MGNTEILIILFNLLSVYYATKNSVLTWSYGAFAAVLTLYVFSLDKMYASMLFNGYSAVMCVIGMIEWAKNKIENDNTLIKGVIHMNILLFVLITPILYFINKQLGGQSSLYDALGTSASIVGTWLLLKKDIICWYFWILCDVIYMTYAITNSDYKYLLIYGVMLLLAIYGLIRNYKIYNKIKNERN